MPPYVVYSRWPSGGWVVERSFMSKEYAEELATFIRMSGRITKVEEKESG